MSTPHEREPGFDPRIADWLESDPHDAPARVLETVQAAVPSIPQRRASRMPRRLPTMFISRVAAAALAIVLVAVGGGIALIRVTGPGQAGPGATSIVAPSPTPTSTPTPTASATPVPTATLAPTLTTADVGNFLAPGTYRVNDFAAPFSVTLPAGWKVTEATPNSIGLASQSDGSVNIYLAVVDKVYSDPCHTKTGPVPIGPGVDALVAALSAMKGFDVSDVSDATVGGATGKVFTITNSVVIARDRCTGDMLPFATYDKSGTPVDVAIFAGETDRFWVVETNGTRILMAVTDNKIDATQAVRDSLSFSSPSAS